MKRTAFLAVAFTAALPALLTLPASASDPGPTDLETVSGTVVELVREAPERARGVDQHELALATDTGIVPVSADGVLPTPGTRITAEVARDGDAVRIVDVVSSRAARAARTPVDIEREVYVGLVSPAGYDVEEHTTTIDTAEHYVDQASSYWASQTGGQVRFSYAGTVPAYESAYRCGETTKMWTEAVDRFADAGIDVTGVGKYLVLVAPTGSAMDDDCDYGLGTLGALDAAWNATFVSDEAQSLYAHELGHNLGLAHANALRCDGAQDGIWDGSSFGTSCARWRYEDLLDVMGYSGVSYGEGNLNAPHLDDLGIDPTAIHAVSGSTTVTVPPLSDTAAAGRGVKVTDSDGTTYYVEYRTATGRDAVANRNPYRPSLGVLLYREDPAAYRGHGSYHLDATPHKRDDYDYDRALRPGATFTSGTGTLTITTLSQDASGAVVQINGGSTAEPEPSVDPVSVSLSSPTRTNRDGTATLTATVVSATNAAVANAEVTFQRRVGSTWRTVATATTSEDGVARAVVKLRRSATFRAGTGEPVIYSSSAAVRPGKRR